MEFNAVYYLQIPYKHTNHIVRSRILSCNMGSAKTHDGLNTSLSYTSFKGLKVYLVEHGEHAIHLPMSKHLHFHM